MVSIVDIDRQNAFISINTFGFIQQICDRNRVNHFRRETIAIGLSIDRIDRAIL